MAPHDIEGRAGNIPTWEGFSPEWHRPAAGTCGCGCGERVAARFVRGHQRRMGPVDFAVHPLGCWIWQRNALPKGYGIKRVDGESQYAHRHSYEDSNGAIPKEYDVDHLCQTPGCVNPAHLDAVPHAVNIRRGRSTNLTEQDVRRIRQAPASMQVDLAREFGMSPGSIEHIRLGTRWAA